MPRKNEWRHNESKALLNIMQKYNCFQNTECKVEERYNIIEKEMVTRGFTKKTSKQIRIRWKNLKRKYALANKTKRTKYFPYFNDLDRILGGQKSVPAIKSSVDSVRTKQRNLWSHNETEALLNIMQKYNCFQNTDNKMYTPEERYKTIETEMVSRGFMKKTPNQIYNRWRLLKESYNSAKKTNRTEHFLYFNDLDRILGGQTLVTAINSAVDSSRVQGKQKQILWAHDETEALLNIMQEYNWFQNTDENVFTPEERYEIIEKEMVNRGFMDKTAKEIYNRWIALKDSYYSAKKKNQTEHFIYFNELDQMLSDRTSVAAINGGVGSSRIDDIAVKAEMNVDSPIVTKAQKVAKQKIIFWKHNETEALLNIMEKYNCSQSNDFKLYPRYGIYQIIQKEMVSRGFMKRTSKQIRIRWQNLKSTYALVKKTNRTQYFQYFSEMDRILSGRSSVAAINSDVDSETDDIVLKIEIDEDSPIVTRVQEAGNKYEKYEETCR